MITLEQTGLLTYTAETEDGQEDFFAVLIDKNHETEFSIDDFMAELAKIEAEEDDKLDEEIIGVMDKYGVIEMFDQDDIDQLTEEGRIDPEDLHSSLFEVYSEEQEEE